MWTLLRPSGRGTSGPRPPTLPWEARRRRARRRNARAPRWPPRPSPRTRPRRLRLALQDPRRRGCSKVEYLDDLTQGTNVGFVVSAIAQLFSDQDSQVEGAEVDGALGEKFVSPHHGGPYVGELAVARDLEAVLGGVKPD